MKDAQPHLPSGKLNSNSDKAEHGLGMPYDAERVAAMWLMDGPNATFVGAAGPFNPGPSWEIKGGQREQIVTDASELLDQVLAGRIVPSVDRERMVGHDLRCRARCPIAPHAARRA
jgi:hypothetical protein